MFTVTRVAVNLSTNSLPRLVQAVENHLLLGQQSCRKVVDKSLILLLNTGTRTAKHLLHSMQQHNTHTSMTTDVEEKLQDVCHT